MSSRLQRGRGKQLFQPMFLPGTEYVPPGQRTHGCLYSVSSAYQKAPSLSGASHEAQRSETAPPFVYLTSSHSKSSSASIAVLAPLLAPLLRFVLPLPKPWDRPERRRGSHRGVRAAG